MPGEDWWDNLGPAFHEAIRAAEPSGRMSYRALDAVLPGEDVTARQIEMVIAHLRRRGIELYEKHPDSRIDPL